MLPFPSWFYSDTFAAPAIPLFHMSQHYFFIWVCINNYLRLWKNVLHTFLRSNQNSSIFADVLSTHTLLYSLTHTFSLLSHSIQPRHPVSHTLNLWAFREAQPASELHTSTKTYGLQSQQDLTKRPHPATGYRERGVPFLDSGESDR